LQAAVLDALRKAHPYQEVAYEFVPLSNLHPGAGAGLVGELREPAEEQAFLQTLASTFRVGQLRHSPLQQKPIRRVAV